MGLEWGIKFKGVIEVLGPKVQRFNGSRFSGWVLLTIFGFLEIVDKPTNGCACASGLFVGVIEFIIGNVRFVQSDIKFTLHLSARAFGISQEPDEPGIGFGVEAFGDIVHDRIIFILSQP